MNPAGKILRQQLYHTSQQLLGWVGGGCTWTTSPLPCRLSCTQQYLLGSGMGSRHGLSGRHMPGGGMSDAVTSVQKLGVFPKR